MEKITSWCYSKKSKLIISTIATIVVLSLIFAISFAIQSSPLVATYKVEYVKDVDDVFVQTYYKGEKLVFPEAPTKNGYEFLGWSLDIKGNHLVTHEIVVEKEITFYANWQESKYVLIYNDLEIEMTLEDSIKLTEGGVLINASSEETLIENPSEYGYKFIEWQIFARDEYFGLETFDFSSLEYGEEIMLVPKFESVLVNISFVANMDLFEVVGLDKYEASIGDDIEFKIVLDKSVNNSDIVISSNQGQLAYFKNDGVYNIELSDFNADIIIYISNITLNKYTITYNNDGDVLVEYLNYGENLSFPTFERKGYSLVGCKDSAGRYYSKEFVVTEDLDLIVVWSQDVYKISFPKSSGMYVISVDGEFLTTSTTISRLYGESVVFSLTLSSAYSNSNIEVYAACGETVIYPQMINNEFIFSEITGNMNIVITSVVLNTYNICVDGVDYGSFGYGSWVYVDDHNIKIKDIETLQTINITTMVVDDNFGGWKLNSQLLVNSIVQDIADEEGNIEIYGEYSNRVARVKLVANGGILDVTDLIIVDGGVLDLPTPTKYGYKFAGWFVKLVEVNTVVDSGLSERFEEITDFYMVLYAGWELA